MKLYSYCVKHDSGAAPNPFWGICTLVICKPAIRRTANIRDWIVGLGSKNSPDKDISDCVVYAMQVTEKMSLEDYDNFCKEFLPNKIPNKRSRDYRLHVGDCIYDYSSEPFPKLRWSVHTEENRNTDLSGEFALLSKNFYYFGGKPIKLPKELKPIIHQTQGHKSDANFPYIRKFIEWLENSGYEKNKLVGNPQLKKEFQKFSELQLKCSRIDLEDE
ncbi:MAG: hypothetical protein JNJ43_12740 [Anaerolineales bacterium]|nr:hypothetical protein [Anaerolineales bacterium]